VALLLVWHTNTPLAAPPSRHAVKVLIRVCAPRKRPCRVHYEDIIWNWWSYRRRALEDVCHGLDRGAGPSRQHSHVLTHFFGFYCPRCPQRPSSVIRSFAESQPDGAAVAFELSSAETAEEPWNLE
jgi:hypothetical protein